MNRSSILLATGLVALAGCQTTTPTKGTSADLNSGVDIVALDARPVGAKLTSASIDTARPSIFSAIEEANVPHRAFLTAMRAAGLIDQLQGGDGKPDVTVFVPTDDAFAKLPPGTFQKLLRPENQGQLKRLLAYHIHVGRFTFKQALDSNGTIATLLGDDFRLVIRGIDYRVTVNDANIIKSAIPCSNGVVQWIDGVLLPP